MANALRTLDLNLLPILTALLANPSTTRVAAELGLTQSAVSHALSRLRGHFGDALFVRGKQGLEPTAFARSLMPLTQDLIRSMDALVAHDPKFNPATSVRHFVIGMPELVSTPFIPQLIPILQKAAPNITLHFKAISPALAQSVVEDGAVDLYIGHGSMRGSNIKRQTLYDDVFVCVSRSGGKLTKDGYLDAKHLKLSLQGDQVGLIDGALDQLGLKRKHSMTLPFYLLGFDVLNMSDMIMTVPQSFAHYVTKKLFSQARMYIRPFPFAIEPLRVGQIWHVRSHNDAGHSWLRQTIKKIADKV